MKISTWIKAGAILIVGMSAAYGETMESVKEEGTMKGKAGSSGQWFVINDGVMGGKSESAAMLTPDRTLKFSGTVSLENNGGFASIRHEAASFGIADAKGIRLNVKGDGRVYQLRVRTSGAFDGVAYKADFKTIKGQWQSLLIPWDSFSATFRGRSVPGAPKLKGENIKQLGFLIADKREGPFELEIKRIDPFQ